MVIPNNHIHHGSTRLKVHLPTLGDNIVKIQAMAPDAKLCVMVKGNAYGHGIVEISRYLLESTDVERLGVASLGEAQEILSHLSSLFGANPNLDIVVFSDPELLHPEHRKFYATHHHVKPVAASFAQLEAVLNEPDLASVPLLLKVNTGMNRLGIPVGRVMEDKQLVDRLRTRGIYHLIQHFSVSDEPATKDSNTAKQYERFCHFKDFLKKRGVDVQQTSAANSAAICQGIGIRETYVRPGLMVYGPQPGNGVKGPLFTQGKMVASLETKVLDCFEAVRGEVNEFLPNGVPRDGFVVVVPFGYAEGMTPCQLDRPRRVSINGLWGTVMADSIQMNEHSNG